MIHDGVPRRGPIALHGGGEFEPGDEPFLDAIVEAARRAGRALRIAVVPTAAAREGARTAGRRGVAAFRQAARRVGVEAVAEIALVVDRESASDRGLATLLESAGLVYLPGGHPDLVPGVLAGTPAWQAIRAAHAQGAVVAGASAGAMGLAGRTWSPGGWIDGLGLVGGFVVVPHFAMIEANIEAWAPTIDELDAARLGRLALDERTGVVLQGDTRWRVAGEGRAAWFPVGGERTIARHGEILELAGVAIG